jgi:hypothetical protein
VGIAATGFGIRAGSFKLSSTRSANFFVDKINKFIIDKISKFFIDKISKSFIGDISKKNLHRQNQQVLRLPRSLLANSFRSISRLRAVKTILSVSLHQPLGKTGEISDPVSSDRLRMLGREKKGYTARKATSYFSDTRKISIKPSPLRIGP